MNFILWHDGKENGPYDLATLERSIQAGEIPPQILARLETGTDWKPLRELIPQKPTRPKDFCNVGEFFAKRLARKNERENKEYVMRKRKQW